MKKSFRIRKNEEFNKIISQKHHFSNASFGMYIDYKAMENARVGISVSKRLGDAVSRNKIKRQVRMMFLDVFDFDNSKYDVICIVRNSFLQNDFSKNKDDLEKLLKKAIINK